MRAAPCRPASAAPPDAVLPLQRRPTPSYLSTAGPTPSCTLSQWPPTSSEAVATLPGPTSRISTIQFTKTLAAATAIWIGAACGWSRASLSIFGWAMGPMRLRRKNGNRKQKS